MRRPHGRRGLYRERDPGLPLGNWHLGRGGSLRGCLDPCLPEQPAERVVVLPGAYPLPARSGAECRPSRARRARATGPRLRRRHPEHRHAPHSGREPRRGRSARLDPDGGLSGLRHRGNPRGRSGAARRTARADLLGLWRRPEARRRPLRRVASRRRDEACHRARSQRGADARRRLVTRGVACRGASPRGARPRDRQPGTDCARRPRTPESRRRRRRDTRRAPRRARLPVRCHESASRWYD